MGAVYETAYTLLAFFTCLASLVSGCFFIFFLRVLRLCFRTLLLRDNVRR